MINDSYYWILTDSILVQEDYIINLSQHVYACPKGLNLDTNNYYHDDYSPRN